MFKENTVIILGAGASCDYKFPTGEGLVKDIISTLEQERIGGLSTQEKLIPLYEAASDFNMIWSKLRDQGSLNIDAFLRDNPSLAETAKMLIVYSIQKCEHESLKVMCGRDFNWYRYLAEAIVSGCDNPSDIFNNKLTIITFNYDNSLEYYLYKKSLVSLEKYENQALKYLQENLEIIHVYGSIYDYSKEKERALYANHKKELPINVHLKNADLFKDRIHAIGENKQKDLVESEHIMQAKGAILKAENLFILGFGFDPNNIELLGLKQAASSKRVFCTNYGGHGKIDQAINGLLEFDSKTLLPSQLTISTKGVYEALQKDFSLVW